ncbi:MAG: hypothetical protein MUC49_00870 [Raineya sp.]|jgi:hypothetical protein|nr:hypothetical protein [Raineya sp.]
MKKIIITSLFLIIAFLACNEATQQKAGINETTAKEVENIVSKNGGEGCFIPYQAKTCELMEKETIAKILDIDVNQIKTEDAMKSLHEMGKNKDKPYKGSQYASCQYSWQDKSGKTYKKKINENLSIDVPVGGYVQIGSFAPMKSVSAFKQMYRNVSQEEMNQAFEKADEKLKEKGFDNKQMNNAKDLGKGLTEGRNVEYLDGVGEIAAVITTKMTGEGVELYVLKNGNSFMVSVGIDLKNRAENLEIAKKIALEVLKKCK